jgi:hypothetical protein
MDLTNAITGLQQAKTLGNIQMRVAGKILDEQKFEGSAALKLLEAASNGVNKAGDSLVAAATGLGGAMDVYA